MKAPSEKHLERWVVDNGVSLDESVASILSIKARQLKLPFGIIDILATHPYGIVVVELKKDAIDYASICQCLRYIAQVNRIINCDTSSQKLNNAPVKGMLIGYNFASEDIMLIASSVGIYTLLYDYLPQKGRYEFSFQYDDYTDQKFMGTVDYDVWDEYLYGVIGQSAGEVLKTNNG